MGKPSFQEEKKTWALYQYLETTTSVDSDITEYIKEIN
jgi:hypothetical protein